jgi:hypothetical protein
MKAVQARGGIQAIAISHPHYYSSMVECDEAFDAPIYLNAADRKCVTHASPRIRFWEGDTITPLPDVQLIRLGGHLDGRTVCYWPQGADGRGALLSSDINAVVADRRWVSFLYSYPNNTPLSAKSVQGIPANVSHYRYRRIYGAFAVGRILTGADEAVQRSAK